MPALTAPQALLQAAAVGGKIVRAGEVALGRRMTDLLEEAGRQAKTMRETAALDAELERQRGYEAGLRQSLTNQAQALLEATALRHTCLQRAHDGIVQVVLEAVRSLFHDFDDLARTRAAVAAALGALRQQAAATVRVHPADHAELLHRTDALLERFPALHALAFEQDPQLPRGACVLISDLGRVTCDLESQLLALERAVESSLHDAHSADEPSV